MATGRTSLTPGDFVRVAMAYVDEHGLDALTMRSLGEQLGVDPTALYRHFPNKDALLSAMLDEMLSEVLQRDPDRQVAPRERLRGMLLAAREVFCEHPNLIAAFISSSGQMPNGLELMRRGVAILEDMGVRGTDLVLCMQMLEGVLMGATVFDLTGAPNHHDIRRLRYRAVEHVAYDDGSRSVNDVASLTEAAFAMALDGVLDVCERRATAASPPR